MFDVFSDIFARESNLFSRLDPRVKIAVAGAGIVCCLCSRSVTMPLTLFTLCVLSLPALGVPFRWVVLRILPPVGIALVIVVLQALVNGSTPMFSLVVGPWTLSVKQEGLRQGIGLGSRVLGSVGTIIFLGAVTPAYKIFYSLRWFRIPEGWIEIALLVYRYTFDIMEGAAEIAAAQRVRLGYSSAGRALRSSGILVGTVLIRSMDQAVRTHEAMCLRGYTGTMPFPPLTPFTRRDFRIMACAMLGLLTYFLFAQRFLP